MAITRRQAPYVIVVVAVLTVIGTILLGAWVRESAVAIFPVQDLRITDVQFDEVYMSIMVKNNGVCSTTISEVTIYQNSTSYKVPFWHELGIAGGDEIPIRISRESFNCTSGYTYKIEITARDVPYSRTVVAA